MESRLLLEYKIFSPARVSALCVSFNDKFNANERATILSLPGNLVPFRI